MTGQTSNFYFFAGPCKSGTTWLFEQLSNHPDFRVVGGKDFFDYATSEQRKRLRAMRETHSQTHIVAFNHDAIFSIHDLENLSLLDVVPIIILRDPHKQIISRALHDIRVGKYTLADLERCANISDLRKDIYKRSDYRVMLENLSKYFPGGYIILDLELAELNESEFFESVAKNLHCDAQYFESGSKVNVARAARSVSIISFAKLLLKPILFRLGGDVLWSKIKRSPLVNSLLYKPSELTEERQIIHAKLDEKLISELKFYVSELKEKNV